MTLRVAALALVAGVALAGCADTNNERGEFDGVHLKTVTVDYNGKPIDCIQYGVGHGSLSCDFVKYHNTNP